jgi:hypothetical protein
VSWFTETEETPIHSLVSLHSVLLQLSITLLPFIPTQALTSFLARYAALGICCTHVFPKHYFLHCRLKQLKSVTQSYELQRMYC